MFKCNFLIELDKYYSRDDDDSSSRGSCNDIENTTQDGISVQVIEALEMDEYDENVLKVTEKLKRKLNKDISWWRTIEKQKNPAVLAKLLWDWVEQLHVSFPN